MMVALGEYPDGNLLLLPAVLAQLMLLALGVGMVFSSLVLLSRDWERVLPVLAVPRALGVPGDYSLEIIPQRYTLLYLVNPVGGSLLRLAGGSLR